MSTTSEKLKREARETAELQKKALELCIDVPHPSDWWWDDSEDIAGTVRADQLEYCASYYLTEKGKAGYRRLIREELARLREEQATIKDRRIRWICQNNRSGDWSCGSRHWDSGYHSSDAQKIAKHY